MMAEEKAYWRVFQQQNVLDGLRIFIDLSDEFLELLRKDDVISEKTLDRIKVGLDQVWTSHIDFTLFWAFIDIQHPGVFVAGLVKT